jgi:subtilisin family serine protease
MLVVTSAGNEGNNAWRYISAPADGDSVLTVGAVDSLGRLAAFSSIGPTSDGRLKPNLVAQGVYSAILTKVGSVAKANGTSFSSPVLAGMATCFWQANPGLTNMEVISYLQKSATKANNPDNLFGYGIPNGYKAYEQARTEKSKPVLYPNPAHGSQIKLRVGPEFRNQKITISFINMIAQKLWTQTFQGKEHAEPLTLDVSFLRPGMYGCIVSGDKNQQAFKFLKL